VPRLKEAGREAANDYATQIFNIVFGDRDPVAEPGTATGTPGNWWTVFNIVPDAFEHTTEGFRFYRSKNRLIDPEAARAGPDPGRLHRRQPVCLLTALQGLPPSRHAEEQIQAIPHWQVAT
jgi:hypothetical protein